MITNKKIPAGQLGSDITKQDELYSSQTNKYLYYYNDFLGRIGASGSIIDGTLSLFNAGTANQTTNTLAPSSTWKNVGTPLLSVQIGSTGGSSNISSEFQILLGNGVFKYETLVQQSMIGDATNSILITSGLSSRQTITTSQAAQDGCFFELASNYIISTTSPSNNWQCVSVSGGVKTITITSVPQSLEWVKLSLEVNELGTEVRFFINDSLVATHTTNIPTTARLCVTTGVRNAFGTSVIKGVYIDYLKFLQVFTNNRY
jgi:hypothetical protein